MTKIRTILEQQALRLGKSEAEILADDLRFIRNLKSPSAECLTPLEAELFFIDGLEEQRLHHVETCSACAALMDAVQPSPDAIDKLIYDNLPLSEQTSVSSVVKARRDALLFNAFPVAGALAILAGYAYYSSADDRILRDIVYANLYNASPLLISAGLLSLALVVMFCIISSSPQFLRASGAASGFAFCTFVAFLMWRDIGPPSLSERSLIGVAEQQLLKANAVLRESNNLGTGDVVDSRRAALVSKPRKTLVIPEGIKISPASADVETSQRVSRLLKISKRLRASDELFRTNELTASNTTGGIFIDSTNKPIKVYWTRPMATDAMQKILLGYLFEGEIQTSDGWENTFVAEGRRFRVGPDVYLGSLAAGQRALALVDYKSKAISRFVPIK